MFEAESGFEAGEALQRIRPKQEDQEFLKAAAAIGRELERPDRSIYWLDLIATAIVAYASFAGALLLPLGGSTIVLGLIAALAFYRGLSFIHELSHVRRKNLPGFAAAWNLLFGVPLLTPSFLYDGVHVLHHSRTSYGTAKDPEYLPLASMRPRGLLLFLAVSALAPVALLVRFALLAPLGAIIPGLRRIVVERYSALAINPGFRRRAPTGAFHREWNVLESAASGWALALVLLAALRVISLDGVLLGLAIGSAIALVNQFRTLVAHLWDNETGEPMSLTAQYLDSVNVPPPALLPALWAAVGLRYHALHHLLPSVPYHALGTVHRRLLTQLGERSTLTKADHRSIFGPLRTIFVSARD